MKSNKIISVVLTTYNGERYLYEQLVSILQQTLTPDEVIVFDDNSKDNSCSIIEKFINANKLSSWQLHRNIKNIGWKQNFINAISLSKGDIVFLCDQDDIWMPDKIELMADILIKNKNIRLLAGNSLNFYCSSYSKTRFPPFYSFKNKAFNLDKIWNGKSILFRLNSLLKEKKANTGEIKKIEFDESLFAIQRQGCVMAITRELINDVLPFWFSDCPHDTIFWFYAAATDSLYLYEKYVINYRHHSANSGYKDTIGGGITAKTEIRKIREAQKQIIRLMSIITNVDSAQSKEGVLNKIYQYGDIRIEFLSKRGFSRGLQVIKAGKNIGKRQILFDWLLAYLT